MKTLPFVSLPLVLLSAFATTALAQAGANTAQLQPVEKRISDQAIHADHQTYQALQKRLQTINEQGRPQRDYTLSKAQCWLDVSFHEYSRNDRSAFPQAALSEAEKLVIHMEATRDTALTAAVLETPLVNGAAKLRPDLWERTLNLRTHSGFSCAQKQAACAEVELVHAGNEYNQQQWRHAKPYVQIAEDELAQAQQLAENCPTAPAAMIPVPVVQQEKIQLISSVVFGFDRYQTQDIRAFSVAQLQALLAKVKTDALQIRSIQLIGHADRLNSTGNPQYNAALSQKRVNTVRAWLVNAGVEASLISTDFKGDSQPIESCAGKFAHQAELQECLLPNRRVEVLIEARR